MTDRKRLSFASRELTTFLVGMSIMLVSWVMDAALDTAFERGSFFSQLLTPADHDMAIRIWFAATVLFFVIYISRTHHKQRQQEARVRAALHSAELERTRAQAVLESLGDAISLQDLEMKILYQNKAHIAMMGEHLGEYCYQAYQGEGAVCSGCHLDQSYRDGESHKTERQAVTAQGLRCTEIISTPLRDTSGRIVAGVESVRDVTERKRAELEIERMNRELELRALELVEANRELESFCYSLSHDLRSYITRISTAQQILAQTPRLKETEFAYPVGIIEDSCRGMEELIEAILTLSRLSREAMHWEDVPLSELAQQVVLQLRQEDLQRQVEVVIQPGLVVRGDRNLLRVVLENLFANAWKYTAKAPTPRIELGSTTCEGKTCFYVRDNGIGFDMEEQALLFRPFKRLKSSQGYPGTGVGLATVERAVQRHGGKVWGEGAEGEGACFYFMLPEKSGSGAAGV
ncbi:sensor histidine kinase [Geomonas silvestris]|uniref:histidine kinase n=1 Tax=Geomonas silvestris TaxID=2740184 RepID=A0A6V8MIK2_9BACT|nr:ATP-binding protein [Geomonas silvestris]GFO59802.1 sensor histidine kinase [Geomonas silvestris]